MAEEWRVVPGFPHVEASDLGRVRTLTHAVEVKASAYRPAYVRTIKGTVLRPWLTGWDRKSVSLPGKRRAHVAQLVCRAFYGAPPAGKPYALHRNGIATDDRPTNLYWGDHADNMADARRHGTMRGERQHMAKLTEAQAHELKRRRTAGERGHLLAAEFGISQQALCDIYKGRTWSWLEAPTP